jgi:hypothetical protein
MAATTATTATTTSSAPLLQTLQLEHLPASHTIHIALFRNITNAAFLQQQLLAGNSAFEYALIDASVVSPSICISLPIFVLPSVPSPPHFLLDLDFLSSSPRPLLRQIEVGNTW